LLTTLWTVYSGAFWLRRDTLRLRFFVEPGQGRRVRVMFFLLLAVHWAWQCYYLTR
jgi:hypothetical protein